MNALVAVVSVLIVAGVAVFAAYTFLGPLAFGLLAAFLGFFAFMAACAKFWST
jgi:hypothetical protein